MTRRTYIYMALPLFVILSCGQLLCACLGATGALIVASLVILLAWGVVWVRLYSLRLRPEFAVLSILPHGIYYAARFTGTQLFATHPALQNLYALTWLGFVGVGLAGMRDTARPASKDPVFLLMVPLVLLYSISAFTHCYSTLQSL